MLNSIVKMAGINENVDVLEIGAGAGTLTRALCQKAGHVLSFEIDHDLEPVLDKLCVEYDNLHIVFADFMKQDMAEIEQQLNSNYYVVANIPYYITTPIITKLFDETTSLKSMILMVQKEVAQRYTASAGTKDYGSISVYLNAFGDVKILKIIDKKMFTPVPKVDSAIIKIDVNKQKYKIDNQKLFLDILRLAFNNRRKMYLSNLKQVYPKDKLQECFKELGIDEQIRGEGLKVEQFVALSNLLNKKMQTL